MLGHEGLFPPKGIETFTNTVLKYCQFHVFIFKCHSNWEDILVNVLLEARF